jgi:tetratricopeptide (TPR) repeat protein
MQLLGNKHLITVAVAVGIVALSIPDGGFAPTVFAAAGLIVWAAVLIGLATGLFPRSEPPAVAVAAGLCLAAYAGLIALSMAWASDDGGAFEDAIRASAYLGVFVLVVVASPRGSAAAWLRGLAIGLTAIGAIALLARFQPSLFGNPDAELAADLPAVLGRLTYPVGYWNGLAAMMAAAVALLGWFATNSASRPGRALAAGALPLPLLALWMTGSRGGFVAGALALAILIAAGPARSRLIANLALAGLGGAALIALVERRDELLNDPLAAAAGAQGDQMLALAIVVALVVGAVRYALDRRLAGFRISHTVGRVAGVVYVDPVQQFKEFKQAPTAAELADGEVGLFRGGGSGRWQFWETAVDAFESAPLAGTGAAEYTPYWLEHREYPLVAKRAHSLLFETLAELGIAGFALIVGFFTVAAVAGVRRWRESAAAELGPAAALLGVGLAAAAVDWTWDVPAVFVPTVIAAALLAGPATLPPGDAGVAIFGTVRSRRRFARGVALLLVAWLSICASGLLLLSDRALSSSESQAADGDLAGAIDSANEAIDLQPWASEPRARLSVLYEQAGELGAARAAIEQAIARDRRNWELYVTAARLAQKSGSDDAYAANLARAAELNPLDERLRPR